MAYANTLDICHILIVVIIAFDKLCSVLTVDIATRVGIGDIGYLIIYPRVIVFIIHVREGPFFADLAEIIHLNRRGISGKETCQRTEVEVGRFEVTLFGHICVDSSVFFANVTQLNDFAVRVYNDVGVGGIIA